MSRFYEVMRGLGRLGGVGRLHKCYEGRRAGRSCQGSSSTGPHKTNPETTAVRSSPDGQVQELLSGSGRIRSCALRPGMSWTPHLPCVSMTQQLTMAVARPLGQPFWRTRKKKPRLQSTMLCQCPLSKVWKLCHIRFLACRHFVFHDNGGV